MRKIPIKNDNIKEILQKYSYHGHLSNNKTYGSLRQIFFIKKVRVKKKYYFCH